MRSSSIQWAFARRFLTILLALAVAPATVYPGDITEGGQPVRPRVAVVLSGGGARGGVHIGVLRALEKAGVPIDLVVGTSFGALVGGLYSVGYSTQDIELIIASIDWQALFDDLPDRRLLNVNHKARIDRELFVLHVDGFQVPLPQGLQAGQKLKQQLDRLTAQPVYLADNDFDRLPIPFRAVATDILTGEPHVFRSGSMSTAIRASISVPGLFTPVAFGETLLVDGGIADNLPVDAALDAGSDFVVAVDASTPLMTQVEQVQSLLDIFDQAISFHIEERKQHSRDLADVVITPLLDDFDNADFSHAYTLISRGEEAVQEKLEEILSKLQARGSSPVVRSMASRLDAERFDLSRFVCSPEVIVLEDIRIEGLDRYDRAHVMKQIRSQAGMPVSLANLDRDVSVLYATGLFGSVGYRLEKAEGRTVLTYEVQEVPPTEIGFGFRYDRENLLAGIVELTRKNLIDPGDAVSLKGMFGKSKRVEFSLDLHPFFGPSVLLSSRLRWQSVEHIVFRNGVEAGDYQERRYGAEGLFQRLMGNWGSIGFGGVYERVEIADDIDLLPEISLENLSGIKSGLEVDLLDNADFPTGGAAASVWFDWMLNAMGSDVSYRRFRGTVDYYASPRPGTTLGFHGFWGLMDSAAPFFSRFHIGGAGHLSVSPVRFIGLKRDAILARHCVLAGLSYRQRLRRFSLGNLREISFGLQYQAALFDAGAGSLTLEEAIHGLGAGLYLDTWLPGPIRLEFGWTEKKALNLYFSAGYAF